MSAKRDEQSWSLRGLERSIISRVMDIPNQ